MPTTTHLKCIYLWLDLHEFNDYIQDDSAYSYMFFLKGVVIKIRKPYSTVMGNMYNEIRRNLAYKEFERGRKIEKSAYLSVKDIPCSFDNRVCNNALLLKRFPKTSRLDLLIQNNEITDEILVDGIMNRINHMIGEAKIENNYDVVTSLLIGNNRLIDKLNRIRNTNINSNQMLKLWGKMNHLTRKTSSLLNHI